MRNKKFLIIATLFVTTFSPAQAQAPDLIRPTFSIESRITNLFQGGYEIGLFFNSKSNFSFGLQFAAQNVSGGAKELLFNSSNHDNLDIRLPWLVALKTRYHLKDHKEGVYFELSTGLEQFRVSSGVETQRNNNGFILPSVGYIWHPWGREGFYLNPNVGYIYAFGREAERTINGTTYELKPFFPSPALSLGWKFK
ncbi:MAG: hypothetical protein HC912_02555 [Saprospiraceae bacterium]|nr:hypothetical protein [Saprospiraceae bacterium]